VLKKIAYESDWKTVVNYCKISRRFKILYKDIWREKTIFEFSNDYWLERYKDPLRNYLAARIRYLWNEYNRLINKKFDLLPLPKGYSFRGFIENMGNLYFRLYQQPGKMISNMKNKELVTFINNIDKYEIEREREIPKWPRFINLHRILEILGEYYKPLIDIRSSAINIRREIQYISDLLISYLRSITKETQSFMEYVIQENGIVDRLNLILGKNITVKGEGRQDLITDKGYVIAPYNYGVIIFIDNNIIRNVIGFTEDRDIIYLSSSDDPLIIDENMQRILLEFGIPIFMMENLYTHRYVKALSDAVLKEMLEKEITY
jgi:hypothetical protein